jgi:hypothetical protein
MSKRSDAPRFKFCVICGKRYERIGKQSNKSWESRVACGRTCGIEYLRRLNLTRKPNRLCQQCRVTKLFWYQGRFCSNSCREIWDDEHDRNDPASILQEWPEWMETEKPFAAHDCDPGDGNVVRMRSPDPRRFGVSLYGSSADWAVSYGSKAGPWGRGVKK